MQEPFEVEVQLGQSVGAEPLSGKQGCPCCLMVARELDVFMAAYSRFTRFTTMQLFQSWADVVFVASVAHEHCTEHGIAFSFEQLRLRIDATPQRSQV